VFVVARAVRIVPQARARNVERLGRYYRTPQPGLNMVIPFMDGVLSEDRYAGAGEALTDLIV
jgi:regulator of protease activity HflC (stomatin/prohibitin superfamily)